eukprot:490066_1
MTNVRQFTIHLIGYIILSYGYLDPIEVIALNKLYNEWNGKNWSPCTWNMTIINDTNKNNFIRDGCGLYFNSHTYSYYQYVNKIMIGHYFNIVNLTGTIPSAIGNLSYLTTFGLFDNELYGTIPIEFCNMTHLTEFYSQSTGLSGTIPQCLFQQSKINIWVLTDMPNITVYSTNIEQLCNNINIKNTFPRLTMDNINYIGHLPSCIGFLNMVELLVSNLLNLNGTIPSSISNLIHLNYLYLYALPSIDKQTNKPQIYLQKFSYLQTIILDLNIIELNCSGHTKTNIQVIVLYYYNEYNLMSVPTKCIYNNKKDTLSQLEIYGDGFNGSINEAICSLSKSLLALYIQDTNHLNINISHCLSQFNTLVGITLVNNSNLKGTLPKYALNSSDLVIVEIQNNRHLTGDISHLLTIDSLKNLNVLALDGNDFFDKSVTEFLQNIFTYATQLQLLTLHGNKYLSGSLPTFSKDIYLDNLQVLTLHNLDIYGTISDKIHLSQNVSIEINNVLFTLYGNRISGSIPNGLFPSIHGNNKQFTPIIL